VSGRAAPRSALPADSGKLDLLQELIEEVVDGGHRALIFSQSTRVLDLIAHWFGQWGVTSLRIDGSTPALDRAKLTDTFNADASIDAFLLSTRAAGTGLNLVGADTVIFYDHDWNPANDAQAMDRAYRIGQTRNVTVYKLVSRGTLEEKILARQSEKLSLAEGVIGADAAGFKDLSRDELLDLFTLDGEA
jgi:helicase SWR1